MIRLDPTTRSKWTIIGVIAAVLIVLSAVAGLYIDWLWFSSLNFTSVFATTFLTRWAVGLAVFAAVFLVLFLNLLMTRRYVNDSEPTTEDGREIMYEEPPPWERFIKSKFATWIFAVASFVVALLMATVAADNWMVIQQYIHAASFGIKDPIFGKDVSFYVFNLSFYKLVYSLLMPTLVITVLGVGIVYLMTAALDFFAVDWQEFNWPKRHLALLVTFIFALKAWGYSLASYSIMFSSSGAAFGAGYTDVHARLLAYRVLLVVTLIVAALILLNLFVKRLTWVLYSIGAWVVVAVLLGGFYPGVVQKLSVEPNEFNREKPYILNNIKYTRAAYGLSGVETKPFNTAYDLKWSDLENNRDTVNNIRLWDWQPLKETLKAIQEIRSYYTFNDIDVDRYMIDGQYRQVMLAPRELSQANLPVKAQTWVNQKLIYTHGYGITMTPVNEVGQEGLPRLFIKDIPPRTSIDLKVDRPEVYYGEVAQNYVIVNSKAREFDYPLGAQNAYAVYKEKSGIKMGSIGRRLLLAWVLSDYKLLLSSDVTANSQVLMYRNIGERLGKIAPFLRYDADPYTVVVDGKLYWMIDAYTMSSMYPYSEPFNGEDNYIRNSVKVVIDAYNGKTTFYRADDKDPLIMSYSAIFPDMFKPISEMPESLRAHVRYPEDIFSIQASMYTLYHMTDPWVFYNKEDKWNVPQEIFANNKSEEVQPYYLIMKLPDQKKAEYVLMLPFTPNTKENMIGWLCARSDGENYGKIRVYDFSKQELIYGPMQVESRINQNSEISQQLTLWSQKGSRVYRGNLLVVPIKNSILYIEPLYLQAERSKIPELRRIIAVYGDSVVMEPTLEGALLKLFTTNGQKPETTTTAPLPGDTVETIAKQAKTYFDKAQNALKAGDWAGYGENMKLVSQELQRLLEKAGTTKKP